MLLSVPCTAERPCTKQALGHERYGLDLPRRYFEANYEEGTLKSEKITSLAGSDAVMIIPMDLDDDGRMDMIVQRCVTDAIKTTCSINAIYTNLIFDSFFIKAMMLSQTSSDQEDLGQKMYGSNIAGATFRYIVTTLDDDKYVRVAA